MSLQQRIEVLAKLGHHLEQSNEALDAIIHKTYLYNKWLTAENTQLAIQAFRAHFLDKNKLETWAAQYDISENNTPQIVALVLSGKTPLEGLQDIFNVFIAGHQSVIKLSDKNEYLIPHLISILAEIQPESAAYFETIERIKDIDRVIVTHVDSATRYYETYFEKYPNIIRKKRTSVAILTGNESEEDWKKLGIDVFRFFGLSRQNPTKLYVPRGHDFAPLLEFWKRFEHLTHHDKFKNNFDYNYSLIIMNGMPHISNGIVLMQEAEDLYARTSMLHYEYYDDINEVAQKLQSQTDHIQNIISNQPLGDLKTIPFGTTHYPDLNDYPNHIDTMKFLT